jgi:alpha-L-fucosidase
MISAFSEDTMELGNVRENYLPPECDVPIRSNWFWHPDDSHTLKTLEHLMGIYYRSVGYGSNLLLNVPPDRDGLLDASDSKRLLEMSAEIEKRFSSPFPGKVEKDGKDFLVDFGQEISFDHLRIQENLKEGQQIDGYGIFIPGSDEPFSQGATVGSQKIHAFKSITGSKIVIRTNSSEAEITNVQAFKTGHEQFPRLGDKLDYEKWAEKADQKEE